VDFAEAGPSRSLIAHASSNQQGALVIATHNPGKLRRDGGNCLAPHGVEGRFPRATLGPRPNLRKTGQNLSRQCGDQGDRGRPGGANCRPLPTISGLVVDALDGAPGIYSARWGPARARIFMAAMRPDRAPAAGTWRDHRRTRRSAHFVFPRCASPGPTVILEEVGGPASDGTLVWPPRGSAGFGYDPAFQPDGQHADLWRDDLDRENHGLPPLGLGLSHRARAPFVKLAEICLG